MTPALSARAITKASKSNLALAFISLSRDRREDITVFYAWCRIIDDIADDPGQTVEARRAALDIWKQALFEAVPDENALAAPVRALIAKYRLRENYFIEIIAGVEMDLAGTIYETFQDLRLYCYRVASIVGLVSIEIFGYQDEKCKRYAVDLGIALQLTNILRDVGQDYANDGRIYLPRQDMSRFGYIADDLAARRWNDAFRALMQFEAERAISFHAAAESELPAIDRGAMTAAEIMRTIYRRLLTRMQTDGFRVFTKRYKLTKFEKLMAIVFTTIRCRVL